MDEEWNPCKVIAKTTASSSLPSLLRLLLLLLLFLQEMLSRKVDCKDHIVLLATLQQASLVGGACFIRTRLYLPFVVSLNANTISRAQPQKVSLSFPVKSLSFAFLFHASSTRPLDERVDQWLEPLPPCLLGRWVTVFVYMRMSPVGRNDHLATLSLSW